MTYYKPSMPVWDFAEPLLSAPHVLIAGATGSGKNVLLDDMIFSLFGSTTPASAKIILVDPKRVELVKYKSSAFCIRYASEPKDIISAIDYAIEIMDERYKDMQREGSTLYEGSNIYLIIDELADLMITIKADVLPRLQRLAQLGRSARVHVWAASQSPSRITIPAALTLNFTHKIALRCDSAIESRQVIGRNGAELLPIWGECFIKAPGTVYKQAIPLTPPELLDERIAFWKTTRPKVNKKSLLQRIFCA